MASIFLIKATLLNLEKDILEIYKMNEVDYDQIVKNGLALIKNQYDLKDFNKKIEKYYYMKISVATTYTNLMRQDPEGSLHAINFADELCY